MLKLVLSVRYLLDLEVKRMSVLTALSFIANGYIYKGNYCVEIEWSM